MVFWLLLARIELLLRVLHRIAVLVELLALPVRRHLEGRVTTDSAGILGVKGQRVLLLPRLSPTVFHCLNVLTGIVLIGDHLSGFVHGLEGLLASE